MIPVLFSKTATDFTSYGIGALSDTISCVVTEERNGLYELEMQYPTSGIHFSEIENSAIILAKPNESQNAQAFRIYQIESPIDEVCTISAEHISYQLNHIPVDCFSATGISDAFVKLKQYSLTQNPFTFYTDKTSQSSFQNKLPKSARALLGGEAGSFLQKFKGEYLWDNWTVSLLNARGSDNGVVLRYGKNITDFNKDENYSDTVTGICPYWTNEGTVLVGDITKVNTTLPYDRVEVMDVSSDIELPDEGESIPVPTKAQVTAAGAQELNNKSYVGVPATNITISFVALWQTEEYKDIAPLESVGLCDTVTVIYEKYGVSKKEKVIKTVYDTLLERYNEIEIGDPHYNLATSFASVLEAVEDNNDQILLEVSRRKNGDEAMSAKIDITAEQIQSTVARTQKEWNTTGYNVTEFGYDSPTAEGYEPSEYTGEYYLNQTNGYLYYSNGSVWNLIKYCDSIQVALQSQITQTAGQIELKVSKGDVSSQLSLESGQISITSNRLYINTSNFKVELNGHIEAKDGDFEHINLINGSGITIDGQRGIEFGNYGGYGYSIVFPVEAVYLPSIALSGGEQIAKLSDIPSSSGVQSVSKSSPTQVSSSTHRMTSLDVTGSTNVSITYNYLVESSDNRLKTNVCELRDMTKAYMELKPVSFEFKHDLKHTEQGLHYGLIAQDTEKVLRDNLVYDYNNNLVKEVPVEEDDTDIKMYVGDKYYMINYEELHALHIQMIQKQQKKIEELENRIKILEEER